jgi:hypothetical protein
MVSILKKLFLPVVKRTWTLTAFLAGFLEKAVAGPVSEQPAGEA